MLVSNNTRGRSLNSDYWCSIGCLLLNASYQSEFDRACKFRMLQRLGLAPLVRWGSLYTRILLAGVNDVFGTDRVVFIHGVEVIFSISKRWLAVHFSTLSQVLLIKLQCICLQRFLYCSVLRLDRMLVLLSALFFGVNGLAQELHQSRLPNW